MELLPLTVADITQGVLNDEIRYARYGDGEFNCMMGKEGHTRDGWYYNKPLGAALRMTLRTEGFKHCYNTISKNVNAEEWLDANLDDKIEWYREDAILKASLAGQLGEFVEAVRMHGEYAAIVSGNWNLRRFKAFPQAKFVSVEPQDMHEKTLRRMDEICEYIGKRFVVAMFSCGPLSNVMIARLSNVWGMTPTLLDIGSVWDMYVGDRRRSYSLRLSPQEIAELGRKNFDMDVTEWQ